MLYELLRGEQELLSTLDPQLYVKVTGALQACEHSLPREGDEHRQRLQPA